MNHNIKSEVGRTPWVASWSAAEPLVGFCVAMLTAAALNAQSAAGDKMAFEIASVKQAPPSLATAPSFPLDGGDAFKPTGGRFLANFPLVTFIMFAYKYYPASDQRQAMEAHLPGWAHDPTVRFTIDAKAASSNPTKDQFRLMMQSLLADRFKLAAHFETQPGSLFALTLVKPGKLGPKLRPHAEGPPCDAPAGAAADVFPASCGGYGMGVAPDRMHLRSGSRDVTMAYFAGAISANSGAVDRPVVDQTGLGGTYDFTIEFAPEPSNPLLTILGVQPDPDGPTFLDAVREQLGLKLESTKGPIQALVIDHVERPSEN
jgi:bla regulator protein BlaR1